MNKSGYSNLILEATRVKLGYQEDDESHDDEVIKHLQGGQKMSKSSTDEIDKEKFWKI